MAGIGRARAVLLAIGCALVAAPPSAHADAVDDQVSELRRGRKSKVRLAALLALTSSRDPRALPALCVSMATDADAGLRLVAVKSVAKALATTTAAKARTDALAALRTASADRDRAVRAAATAALTVVAGPGLLIHVDGATDQTKRGATALATITKAVRGAIGKPGYVTAWPGGVPTSAQLTARGARAFIVGSSVTAVSVKKTATGNNVGCTVQVRVAPWEGRDVTGGERWVADQAATATGSATIVAGASARAVDIAIGDCTIAVAEELAARKIVPFLRKAAGKP